MMTATCDGCGKQERAAYQGGNWQKPKDWWFRADEDGDQLACNVRCRRKVAKATGKSPDESPWNLLGYLSKPRVVRYD